MSQPHDLRADDLQPPHLRVIESTDPEPALAHRVPSSVRHADIMTGEALATRLQAITRLGVVPAPEAEPTPGSAATPPTPGGAATSPTPGGVAAHRSTPLATGVPDPRAWGSKLVQAVSEVLAGDRPISQLVRFTDEAVFTELNRRVRLLGLSTTATGRGAKERSAVRSVRVCKPAVHVAEVAAHVRHGERSCAIALRMEIRRNRWVCTALELG
jgi:hypothetical protein